MESITEMDIIIYLYPRKDNLKQVIVVDPYDRKILHTECYNISEVKEKLKEILPFDIDGNINAGRAFILDWESQELLSIIYNEDDVEKNL